jgi:hypothetical protein
VPDTPSVSDRRRAERYRWSSDEGRKDPATLPVRLAARPSVPIKNISATGVLVSAKHLPGNDPGSVPGQLTLVLEAEPSVHRLDVEVSFSEARFEGLVFSIAADRQDTVRTILDRLVRGGVLTPVGGRRPEWSLNVTDQACFEGAQCPVWPDSCKQCGEPIPQVHRATCTKGHAQQYPNIVEACRPKRRRAVIQAFETSTTRMSETERRDARAVLSSSSAVLSCNAEVMLAVLWGVAKFPNYHDMVARMHRPPDGPDWDLPRTIYDESVFPGYKEDIRFAALSLDGRGVRRFGACVAKLREDVLCQAASVFVENSFFAREKARDVLDSLPAARAAWLHRDLLAVAKLAGNLPPPFTHSNVAPALLVDSPNVRDDEFVEVHVFGPIGAEAVTEVSVPPNERKLEDIREACQRNQIGFRVRG